MEERTSPFAISASDGSERVSLEAFPYLDRALDMPTAQREPWLRELESREPVIAADVRRLLAARATASFGRFLNEPVTQPPTTYALPGESVGSFRVVRELGQGGMAVVYLAERADGNYSQRVALKILRYGLAGSHAQYHFAQERQILASLEHQSIARLLDAGQTASGLSYLAMEYVEGVTIDRYCDEQRSPLEDRLNLFVQVAEAVQYAHRHLIVHRDLKCSNIVVTQAGVVKLLDFGIAKLLEPATLDHAAPPTRDGVWLMTPECASPEQVLGKPISTATDVYQLGLLLYGLLAGRPPYSIRGRAPVDAFRIVCESEPLPPSAVCDAHLRRSLRGDLDTIVMKMLRKEPAQRYTSVSWLIDDLRRHQSGLPISAREGLWFYRAVKFCRRNVATLSIVGIAVLTLAFVTTWYTVQLSNEKNRAKLEAASATQVAEFLASVFRGSSTRVANGGTTARELLDRGAERIEAELADEPAMRARLLNVIGDVYVQYHLADQAQPLLERALLQNTQLYGRHSKEAAENLTGLATLARQRDDMKTALSLYEEALKIQEQVLGPRHVVTADTLSAIGGTYLRTGDSLSAIRYTERALDIFAEAADPDDERTLSTMNTLAISSIDAGDLLRARTVFEQLQPRIERTLGPDHRNFASSLGNLAYLKLELGDYDGVEEGLKHSIQIFERLYGPDHGNITARRVVLGYFYSRTGRLSEALEVLQQAIDSQRRLSGPGDRIEAHALLGMGRTLRSRGDLQAASQRLQASMDVNRKLVGTANDDYAESLQAYGEVQLDLDNVVAAKEALTEALATLRDTRLPDHYEIAISRVAHALLLIRTGHPDTAEKEIRAAMTVYQRIYRPEHPLMTAARGALGEALLEQGRIADAEPLLIESAKLLQGTAHYERRLALKRLIRLYERQNDMTKMQQTTTDLAAFERDVRSR